MKTHDYPDDVILCDTKSYLDRIIYAFMEDYQDSSSAVGHFISEVQVTMCLCEKHLNTLSLVYTNHLV